MFWMILQNSLKFCWVTQRNSCRWSEGTVKFPFFFPPTPSVAAVWVGWRRRQYADMRADRAGKANREYKRESLTHTHTHFRSHQQNICSAIAQAAEYFGTRYWLWRKLKLKEDCLTILCSWKQGYTHFCRSVVCSNQLHQPLPNTVKPPTSNVFISSTFTQNRYSVSFIL